MPLPAVFSAGLLVATVLASAGPEPPRIVSHDEQTLAAVSAPPRRCEIRQKAWCIYQEGIEITNLQKLFPDDSYDHAWTLHDALYPYSQLVVFEPNGCREGFANTVTALGFEEQVKWRGKLWDQIRVRLISDGSCDLRLLVPMFDGQPVQWAFNSGPGMIAACMNEQCDGDSTTLTGVRDTYWNQYRRRIEPK